MKVNRMSHTHARHTHTHARACARKSDSTFIQSRSNFFLIFNDHVTRISRLSSWKLWNLASKFSIFFLLLDVTELFLVKSPMRFLTSHQPKLERSIGGTSAKTQARNISSFFVRFSDRLRRHTFLVFIPLSYDKSLVKYYETRLQLKMHCRIAQNSNHSLTIPLNKSVLNDIAEKNFKLVWYMKHRYVEAIFLSFNEIQSY